MPNEVLNATCLDGATDWRVAVSGALSVDEAGLGAPGRAVMTSMRNAIGAAIQFGLACSFEGSPVAAGQMVEAACLFECVDPNNAPVAYLLELEVVDAAGVRQAATPLPVLRRGYGYPQRGLAASLSFAWGVVPAPAAGFARIRLVGTTAAGGIHRAIMARPYVDSAWESYMKRRPWTPGPHSNPDLNLPAWPTGGNFPAPLADGFSVKAIPTRDAFAGSTGVPVFRRKTLARRYTADFSLELDQEQRDILNRFLDQVDATDDGRFWFVRPDTHELCRATFTDEEPSDSGILRGGRRTSVQLLLEVS